MSPTPPEPLGTPTTPTTPGTPGTPSIPTTPGTPDGGGLHVFGGGTVSHVRNHLALCAVARGTTARRIAEGLANAGQPAALHLTFMADPASPLITNEDVSARVDALTADPTTRLIVMSAALCDYSGQIGQVPSGPHAPRLASRDGATSVTLTPVPKVLSRIHRARPDILVVGFKTTTGATPEEQYRLAAAQIASSGCALVLANDTVLRRNLLVPADARALEDCPAPTTARREALTGLVHAIVERLPAPRHPRHSSPHSVGPGSI